MSSRQTKTTIYFILTIILTLGLSISLQSLLAAWTAPAAAPPNNNISEPINIASIYQVKNGGLGIGGNFLVGTNSFYANSTTGNVGIGITSPTNKLQVGASAAGNSAQFDGTISIGSGMGSDSINRDMLQIRSTTNGTGHSMATFKNVFDQVMFNVRDDGLTYLDKLTVNNDVTAAAYYYSSDASLKKNIQVIPNALKKVQQLNGVMFNWKKDGSKNVGLIAQDVEKVFPELVRTDSATGLKSIEYGNLVAPLIEAIKDQQSQIEDLQKQIKELKDLK